MAHINVNRLINKMDEIKNVIKTCQFKILAISETWLTDEISDGEINIPDFRVFRRDRDGRRGGGVCLYVHHTINFKLLTNISHPTLEMIWINMQIAIGYHNLNVGCLYRPPDERVQFWTTLEEVLEPLEGSDIVLLGDLNVDTLDKTHPQFSYLNRLNYSLQTKDIVCSPTRCTATSSKCLDVILTNVHYFKKGAVMEDLDISDHALVYCCGHFPGRGGKYFKYAQASRNWRRMNVTELCLSRLSILNCKALTQLELIACGQSGGTSSLLHLMKQYPKKLSKTIEKGRNIALGCLRNYFTYSTNRRVCTDGLRKLTINNKILFFVTESWGTEPTTFIDNSKTSIFKTNSMLIDGIPKHFGPQSTTSPVGKKPIIPPPPPPTMQLLSLTTSSLFFTSLVLPMHFPLVQTKKMHCVHSLQ